MLIAIVCASTTQQLNKENDMTTYTMTEKENFNSERDSVEFTAKTLTSAKVKSSKMQAFHGTVLELEVDGVTVAVKEKNGKWIEQEYFAA